MVISVVAAMLVLSSGGKDTKTHAIAASATTTSQPTTTTTTIAPTTTTEPPTTTTGPPATVIVVVTEPPPPPTTTPRPHRITGTLYLFSSQHSVDGTWTVGQSCYGDGGYSDIGPGTQVTVRNEAGTLTGSTTLGPGVVQPWPEVDPQAKRCVFPFNFASVADSAFYGFEVSHRGQVQQSHDELAAGGWHIDLTLGS